ncbi:hypothetical protein NOF04DRAFT_1061622 [Fusarium oxysporum II5]|nr:uncharacterized protein FOIG_07121 [Fusarium odoratissimum NRRL 54006]XP_031063622.1 uncharacterized protein FOIG_07121 [Fusarium odoratissimum NRRL 54006]EXM01532.1 hypothetical protein FOIG_07121 [Fusarium odoratissimum NRRL 54006]EXM01533.1 hypothetical protein FOIG_07121 [Fusarium odoratissimum NRRL 54006]KAK2129761.1 hypothetical protein NOF04DRAFT_1061622 [Fusarium oxysporum II5]
MPHTSKSNQSWAITSPDAQQIASSNQTVNFLFGGRARSWMTGDPSATTNPTRLAPVASSNSRKRNKKRKVSDAAPPTQNDNDIHRDNNPTEQSFEQRPSAGEPARASTVLPSPALTDAPSPNVSNQTDSTNPDPSAHVGSAGPGGPVSDSNMNQSDSTHVATNTNYPSSTAAVSLQPKTSMPQQNYVTQATILPTATSPTLANQAPQATASPLSHIEIRPQNLGAPLETNSRQHIRPPTAIDHQAKRPRVQEATSSGNSRDRSICLKWYNSIEHRVAQAVHAGLLNETVEKPRYRILAEACQNEDFFYIAFHQALCAWSLNRGPIHALFLGLVQPNLLDAAFDVAQTILRKNEHMSHAHLQWFANFPSTIAEFSRVFPNTEAARDISAFLIQLATNWHTLSQNVQARRYPLLASELIFILRCRAKGLQSMLFTMSRRSLGVNDGPVAGAMNVIFDQDREDEAAYEARGEPPETLKRAREAIAMKYRDLVMSAAQRAASNAGSSAHIVAQRGHQSLPPTTTNLSYPVHTASASSPSLSSHFDAFAVRPSVGDPRVVSPGSVNNHSPSTGNSVSGIQGPRRPNHLHIQTDTATSSPHFVTAYQSPQLSQHPLPRSSSAGSLPIQPNRGSPVTTNTPVIPSNGPSRTAILPPNNPLLQRRAASFAHPSQTLPSPYGTYTENQAPHHQLAGTAQVSSPVSQMNPHHHGQPMQSPQFQTAYNQLNPPRRASTSQYNMMSAPSAHVYSAQPIGPRNPAYQVPVASYPHSLAGPVQQIPEADYPASPYGYGSLQVGLQHVGVRSPRRVPLNPGKIRHYQFVRQLVYQPLALKPQRGLRSLSFNVTKDQIQKLAKKIEGIGLPFCYYSEGCRRYRLRMIVQPETQAEPSESDWVMSATCWPSHIFFDLNSKSLELRRKQHFHKDQPLELTDFLVEGENKMTISYPVVEQNSKPGYKHFMAIEIVETMSHGAITDLLHSRHLPAEETRYKIICRLRPSDSDDIIVQDETLPISLADPFSKQRVAVPVRGSQCKHLECFDLETFLGTRSGKEPQKGGGPQQQGEEPSLVDRWGCPICGLDARPISLLVDDYLVAVRRSLISNGDTRTRNIKAAPDGTWSAVWEPEESDDDSPAPQPKGSVNGHASRQPRPPPTPVIDISDDE